MADQDRDRDRDGPMTTVEALTFEDVAGTTVLQAVQQWRDGTLSARACIAAVMVYGQRRADDVTAQDVVDTYPAFGPLAAAGSEVFGRMVVDDVHTDDGEAG